VDIKAIKSSQVQPSVSRDSGTQPVAPAQEPTVTPHEEVSLSRSAQKTVGAHGSHRAKSRPGGSSKAGKAGSEAQAPALPMKKAQWTVLMYMAADNDLEPYITRNLIDLEATGSGKGVNLVAQIDRGAHPTTDAKHDNARRFYITKDNDDSRINSPQVGRLGAVDMGKPETLKDFVKWGMKNFPAEHYLVILNDHGAGFPGALQDDSGKSFMSTPDIAQAIKDGREAAGVDKKDVVLGFDACLMGQAEVAYQLKDSAGILIASEETIGGSGWPYTGILATRNTVNALSQLAGEAVQGAAHGKTPLTKVMQGDDDYVLEPVDSPKEVAKGIITESANTPDATVTLSAVDLDQMPALAKVVDGFAKALLATAEKNHAPIRDSFHAAQHFTYGFEDKPFSDMRDIYDLAKNISQNTKIKDDELKTQARKLMATVKESIIAEQHAGENMENAHGLSIYAPTYKGGLTGFKYGELALAQDTSWDEALALFTGKDTGRKDRDWSFTAPKGPKGRTLK